MQKRKGMNMTILEELYYGNIEPNAKVFEQNSKFGKAVKCMNEVEEKLLIALDGEEKNLFLQFSSLCNEVSTLSDLENFIIGFKLGLQIGIETTKPGGIYFSDIAK